MAMTNCENCTHEISDLSVACINCGHPLNTQHKHSNAWEVVSRAKTPINIFAVAMMTCAAILGMSATQVNSPESLKAFTYTLHIFLAVTGMFFVTILFCRKGVYHPDDLAKAKREGLDDLGEDKPEIAAIAIGLMLLAYGLYQAFFV